MLSQPMFDDRALAKSFYEALVNRFCSRFDSHTRQIFSESIFGIAPGPGGEKTLFIVAPSVDIAQELLGDIDHIIAQVTDLMPGIEQTAICAMPPVSEVEARTVTPHPEMELTSPYGQLPPQLMMGKIFRHQSVMNE